MSQPVQILCSTGTLTRDPDRMGYRAVLSHGPTLAIDALELLYYAEWDPNEVVEHLVGSGLRFRAVHAEKGIGPLLGGAASADRERALERLAVNAAVARLVGADLVVLHLWGLPGSDEHFARNLDALGQCLDIAARHGVDLAIEAIPCAASDPLTRVRQALDRDARGLVALDTEFLALHGQLDAALAADWLWPVSPHASPVRHIHIKDFDGHMHGPEGKRRYLFPGEGNLDLVGFCRGLAARNFQGNLSLEASAVTPDGEIDVSRLRYGVAALAALVEAAWSNRPPVAV